MCVINQDITLWPDPSPLALYQGCRKCLGLKNFPRTHIFCLFSFLFPSRGLFFLSIFLFIYLFWWLWNFSPVNRNFLLFLVLKFLIKISPDQPKFPPNLVRAFGHFLHLCIVHLNNSTLHNTLKLNTFFKCIKAFGQVCFTFWFKIVLLFF